MNDQRQDHSQNDETVAAARDWVVLLTSGEPTAEDMRRFERWLAQSATHRAAFDKEYRFWQRLGGLEAAAGPHTWDDEIGREGTGDTPMPGVGQTQRAGFGVSPARRRSGRRLIAAGSLAAACLALFVFFGDWLSTALLADHRTAEGEQATATLPDGSLVHLNTDSALTVDYSGAERRVALLRGEVLFEVSSDPDRPFRVTAADGVIEAVGTAFVVRRGADAASIAVTEGKVSVTSPAKGPAEGVAEGTTVLAAQGQRTRYRSGGPPRPAEAFDPATVAVWRQGLIVIDDLPLDRALAELDRYRPGRIVLMPGVTDYRSVSGAFDVAKVDAAIAGIAATHGLSVTELTRYLLILR